MTVCIHVYMHSHELFSVLVQVDGEVPGKDPSLQPTGCITNLQTSQLTMDRCNSYT